jgi:hypothetical protein
MLGNKSETLEAFTGSDGTVRLEQEMLSDVSLVYNVVLYHDGIPFFTLCPCNEKKAYELFNAIKESMS